MKKIVRYIILTLGIMFVVLFCVSATASIAAAPDIERQTFSEPINLLLIGFGLIGCGGLIKRKTLR